MAHQDRTLEDKLLLRGGAGGIMAYNELRRRLGDDLSPTVATLPDGSVDHFCTISDGRGGTIESRERFGRDLLGDRSSFQFHVETTEPGGQSVNAAMQLHALGDDVTCYGHLEHSIFDDLAFETVSMGAPTEVYAFNFSDRDVMFARHPTFTEWTLDDLQAVAPLPTVFDVDAVACTNWVSTPNLGAAFRRLGEADLPRVPLVFDPGDVVGRDNEDLKTLLDGLGALQDSFEVVFNGNRAEARETAAVLEGHFNDDLDRLAAIRKTAGITAAVIHDRAEAVVATADERTRVENYCADEPVRHTGGGDRFTGGLTHALACGWSWETALACGNACAVHYVETGKTATAADLIALVDEGQSSES